MIWWFTAGSHEEQQASCLSFTQPTQARIRVILVFDILKFVLAGGALYFGLTDRAPANHVDSLNTALFVFGVVLATHETYFLLVSIAKAAWKAKSLSCGIARVIASMAWSGTDVGPRSALEGNASL